MKPPDRTSLMIPALLGGLLYLNASSAIACGLKEVTAKQLASGLRAKAQPVVVIFCADGAPYCSAYLKVATAAACERPNTPFFKVNLDTSAKLAEEFSIRALPTTLIFRNHEEIKRAIGAASPEKLESMLQQSGVGAKQLR